MFASRITKNVDIQDGSEIVVVTVQKLSARSLQKARETRSAAQLYALRGATKDLLAAFRSPELDLAAQQIRAAGPEARARARYTEFDRETVLNAGIVRWSCEDKMKLSPESVSDLDEDAAEKLHEAILDLSLPPLDPAVLEAELGKG